MKYILSNYKYTPDWLPSYTDDYLIFDQSEDKSFLKDFPQDKIVYHPHGGNADYDKLTYLVDNYDTLPDVFVWGKTNLWKYISKEEFDKVKDNTTFTPLLTMNHRIYPDRLGPVNYYSQGLYWERADIAQAAFNQFASRYFETFAEFSSEFSIENPSYIPFAPGGNYILTKERVHRYSRDFYEKMASLLPYCYEPAEAQMAERSYYLLWK